MRNYRKHYEKDWQIYLECTKCWKYKLPTEFAKKTWRPFWVRTSCKECDSVYWKNYRVQTDKHLNACRKYHEEHREEERLYNREYRKTHKWYLPDPYKKKARRLTYNYIKYNWIAKPIKCSVCWDECKVEIHHPNYDRWNSIVFCCRKCHALIHRWDIKQYEVTDI